MTLSQALTRRRSGNNDSAMFAAATDHRIFYLGAGMDTAAGRTAGAAPRFRAGERM
jgi:hypothetical protein